MSASASASPSASVSSPTPRFQPPKLLREQELQLEPQAISRGQFGSVFRGRYQGQAVAVKKPFASDFDAQMDEFNTLAAIPPHPHVLPVIGAVSHHQSNQIWLVLPFMDGGTCVCDVFVRAIVFSSRCCCCLFDVIPILV